MARGLSTRKIRELLRICYAVARNSCLALLTRSCPNTFRHRSIRTSWRPCDSRRGHPPSDWTNPCPEEGGRSGSTHRGIAGSASVSLRRTTNAAPCVSMTSGSATACSDWRPRTSGGIPTMAGTWFPMGWRCARCTTRRWISGRWGWRGRGVGFGSWCPGGCVGGVCLRGGWWGCGGRGFGRRVARRMRRIGGLWSGIGCRCSIREILYTILYILTTHIYPASWLVTIHCQQGYPTGSLTYNRREDPTCSIIPSLTLPSGSSFSTALSALWDCWASRCLRTPCQAGRFAQRGPTVPWYCVESVSVGPRWPNADAGRWGVQYPARYSHGQKLSACCSRIRTGRSSEGWPALLSQGGGVACFTTGSLRHYSLDSLTRNK